MKNRIGSDLFRSKLNNVLASPQGKEIKNRNWRVSDRFKGGFLKNKSSGLKIDLERPIENKEVDILTKLEGSNEPLLTRIPPMVLEAEKKEEDVQVAQETSSNEEELIDNFVTRTETKVNNIEVVEEVEVLDAFKAEFSEHMENKEYFNAFIVLITAILVVLFTFVKTCHKEASLFVKAIQLKHSKKQKSKKKN